MHHSRTLSHFHSWVEKTSYIIEMVYSPGSWVILYFYSHTDYLRHNSGKIETSKSSFELQNNKPVLYEQDWDLGNLEI